MTAQTEHVLHKMFSVDSLDNIPVQDLRQIVSAHPYFTLGHYLLTKKLKEVGAAEFEEQVRHASLYFNEPIWLQRILQAEAGAKIVLPERVQEEQVPEVPQPLNETAEYSNEIVESSNETAEFPKEENPPVRIEAVGQPAEKEMQTELETKEEEVAFEPYHTIDYFASQGIKIPADLKPNDRLGQQLKSFTEWLKTLKRLPEAQVVEQLDEASQQNIQKIAEHSLDEKEVVTETMAEVLVKQNKLEEALRIYEKLSLLNPSKRAYFAAKIEQLKES